MKVRFLVPFLALPWVLFGIDQCGEDDDDSPTPTQPPGNSVSFDDEAVWSSSTNDWEPFTAADPISSYVYQVTTRYDATGSRVVFRSSPDGGVSWSQDQEFGTDVYQYDPFVAVAADTGCVFFGWLHAAGTWRTYVTRSCDHGYSWTSEVSVAPGYATDHGWLLVSPSGQDVYIGFNGTSPGDPPDAWKAYVSASHDGGDTFGTPWVTGDGGDLYWFQTGGVVLRSGEVYYSASQWTHSYRGDTQIGVWRSTDRGATFDIQIVDVSSESPDCSWADGCKFGFLATQSAIAADPDGNLLLVYHAGDYEGEHQKMWVRTSPGGDDWKVWSDRVQVSSDTSDNAFPTAVGGLEAGDFRVAWQANAPDDPIAWNTWYQHSTDGGNSWFRDPVRVSNLGFGAPYKTMSGYGFPYGDYNAISIDAQGRSHVIWGEGESYNGPGGTWYSRSQNAGE